VGLIRGFKTDAVVRATFVIKVNEGLNTLFGLLITLVAPFFVDYLCLENAVYTLCNGVVCGFNELESRFFYDGYLSVCAYRDPH
jgi:hypothetical protein